MSIRNLVIASLFAVSAAAASASVTTYSDRNAFLAANPGIPVDDYETAPNGGQTMYGGTYSGNGYTITDPGNFIRTQDQNFYAVGFWGLGDILTYSRGGTATFTFATPITAIGLDFFLSEVQSSLDLNFASSVLNTAISAPYGCCDHAFFGMVSSTAFSSFTITPGDGNAYVELGDFYGRSGAGQVPEPGMVGLLGAASMALAFRRRRR